MKKIAVIGAGPAGISAALAAAQNGAEVSLFDHNEKIGKKLFITGKGRCNLTNDRPIEDFFDQIVNNKNFLYSSLYTFTNDMLKDQIEQAGCKLKVERGGRVFPVSDKSSDILKAFSKLIRENDIQLYLNSHISQLIIQDNTCVGLKLKNKDLYFDAVILCSGGKSYPSTGSDGSGYNLAHEVGHSIVNPQAGLIGLITAEKWPKDISGITLKNIEIKLFKQNKLIFSDQGECLFTHTGLSGPVVLSASSYIREPIKDYKISIDLKPGLSLEKLDKRIQRDFEKYINKDFQNALTDLLPKNLIPVIISLVDIPSDLKCNSITKEMRLKLAKTLKNIELNIKGKGPLAAAIITQGGVSTKEINPSTMESSLVKNLYFAGEVIDVDALTGGFNIQIACSTGNLAGMSAATS